MNKLDCLVYLNIRVKEEWKICTRNDNYAVSNFGRVRRIKTGRILKQANNKDGYLILCLYKNGIARGFIVHRLVAEAFIGPCPKGKEVNHIDGNRKNNSIYNLEYVTPKENVRHAMNLGLFNNEGENHHNTDLLNKDILNIRKLYFENRMTQKEIGKIYNVRPNTVSYIIRKKSWSHI